MKHIFLSLLFTLATLLPVAATDAPASSPVRDLGITASYGASAQIFDEVVDLGALDQGVGHFLSTTINRCRKRAAEMGKSPQSIGGMAGHWFEYAVLLALQHHGLGPAYYQAEFKSVPNARNDVMLWTKEHGPVILSCKTSLRERYKQADLEAMALKAHYPDGKFFLLTLDEDKQHVARVSRKIADQEIVALQAIYDEENVDTLVAWLKKLTLTDVPAGSLKAGKVVR